MSALTDFFFKSKPAVVRLQCLEIYHPNFSQTYRFVRNAVGGIYVYHEDSAVPQFYTHIPMKMEEIGSKNNLDQELEVTIGDVGSILPMELDNIRTANNMQVKPTLTYREYTSDDYAMEAVDGTSEWVFDGSNDYVSFADVLNFDGQTDPMSVSFWFRTSDLSGRIIGKGTSTLLWTVSIVQSGFDSLMEFQLRSGSGQILVRPVITTFDDNVLRHVVFSYDGSGNASGVDCQIDGVSVSLDVISDSLAATTVNNEVLSIGSIPGSVTTANSLGGRMSHLAVWSQALNSTQMTSAYGGGTPPTDLGAAVGVTPALWVKMDGDDDIGAGGIVNYGSGATNGTAQGGLSPTVVGGTLAPVYLEPAFGPFNLQINSIAFNKQGCTFTAKPVQFNRSRTGDIYKVERFPMLRGFL